VAWPSMMHDFAITKDHVIFILCPLVFSFENLAKRGSVFSWEPERGTRLGVMPRSGGNADVKWFETEASYVFHPMNAFADGDAIVLDVARYGRGRGRRLGAGARLRPRAQHERLPHPGRAERARRARGRRPPPAPRALRLPRQLGGGMIRFGLNVGYSGAQLAVDMDLVREAERLGFHSVWTAEAYGSDAVTPLAWIGGETSKIRLGSAIMEMAARTPALTA